MKTIIHFREKGYDLEDCATLSGYSLNTIHKWRKENHEFARILDAAWASYKGRLIEKVEEKDPKYLLQNDFSERFKKDKDTEPQQTQNNVFIGYEQLADRLAGILSGSNTRTDQSTPADQASNA